MNPYSCPRKTNRHWNCQLFSLSFSKTHAFDASRVVEVSLGGSTILNMKPKSATLTDQTIAEISKSLEGILLIGRKVGETNLVVLSETGSETYLIKVSLPALAIQSEIVSLFPNERDGELKPLVALLYWREL